MSWLKIVDDKIVEAPYYIVREDRQIFGYNRNTELMIKDGFVEYPKAAHMYLIVDDKIVLKKLNKIEEKRTYSKLEIRRACRDLQLLDKLNKLLLVDLLYAADWQDATEIDLDDQMFVKACEYGLFTEDLIQEIKTHIG